MKSFFYVFLFFLLMSNAFGQSSTDSTTIFFGFNGHYGFILPHAEDLTQVSKSNPWGVHAEISRMRHSRASWNACNCRSQNGLALMYFNFDNPEVLGSSLNLIAFAEPQFTAGKVNFGVRAGIGLTYLNRVFDADTNPQNLFFSHPLSGLLLFQLNSRISLSEHWSLRLASSYNHISNGGARQPNKGMNFPTVSLGAEYVVNPLPRQNFPKKDATDRDLHYYGGLSYTTKKLMNIMWRIPNEKC